MSEKHKEMCRALNYFENFLVFVSAVTGCISFSSFASLVDVPVGIASSTTRIKICVVTAGIQKYKSVIKEKKKKHDKIVFLAKYQNKALIYRSFDF